MKKWFLVIVLFLLPNFAIAQNIDKILEERLKSETFGSGFSVAVVDEKDTKFYNAGKTSKQADAKAANENTVYEIGSITKLQSCLEIKIRIYHRCTLIKPDKK